MEGRIPWHDILQTILDESLPRLCGKPVLEGEREYSAYFSLDYFCQTQTSPLFPAGEGEIQPLNHLKTYNIIEYKSIHETLTERMFRYYTSRALFLESMGKNPSKQKQTTLTIITTRYPRKLMKMARYGFQEIYPWKYRSNWIPDLDVYIIIQNKARGIRGGEPLALLQVLEGDRKYRKASWIDILSKNYPSKNLIERVMILIEKEGHMSLLDEYRAEGYKRAEAEILQAKTELIQEKRSTLFKFGELLGLLPKIEKSLQSAETLADLKKVEAGMLNAFRERQTC